MATTISHCLFRMRPRHESTSILKYWRDVEIFNIPRAPDYKNDSDISIRTFGPKHQLPWFSTAFQNSKTHYWTHSVFLGVEPLEDLVGLVLKKLLPGKGLSEREANRLSGDGWLAAFTVDGQGVPIAETYTLASFVLGMERVREGRSLDNIASDLLSASEKFERQHHCRQESFAVQAGNDGSENIGEAHALTWDHLAEESHLVAKRLDSDHDDGARLAIRVRSVRRRRKAKTERSDPEYLNSFYLNDLDRLISQGKVSRPFGTGLYRYLGDPIPADERVDVLEHPRLMAKLASPPRMPLGRWPEDPSLPLFLAQQGAVNEILNRLGYGKGIIAVNGPPGTGKTTLLRDVIAELVVRRAGSIAAQSRADAIFVQDKKRIGGYDVRPLRRDLFADTGIVVAGNANDAVKLISQELPTKEKIADQFRHASYFADVANSVARSQASAENEVQDNWGLIAGVLGNKTNTNGFTFGFFREDRTTTSPVDPTQSPSEQQQKDEGSSLRVKPGTTGNDEPCTIKQVLEPCTKEWHKWQQEWRRTKTRFIMKRQQVSKTREDLIAVADALEDERELTDLVAEQFRLRKWLAAKRKAERKVERDFAVAQADRETSASRLHVAKITEKPNRIDWILEHRLVAPVLRLLFRYTSQSCLDWQVRLCELQADLDAATHRFSATHAEVEAIRSEIAGAEARLRTIRPRITVLQTNVNNMAQKVAETRQRGISIPDESHYSCSLGEQHCRSLWTSPDLERQRSELFIAALQLHEVTIKANAGKFIAGLRAASEMLRGSSTGPLGHSHRQHLWTYLFFVTPVVSTALASFSRLFEGMRQESIAWLLIDEAGQALPQAAAGAIWRARRTVVIGDPMQVEPVITVPDALITYLRKKHSVSPIWSPAKESVQTLVDRATSLGAKVPLARAAWTGLPLRVHFRCDDPMYTVANQIAYNNQMVRPGPRRSVSLQCCLGDRSAWYNVQGRRSNRQVVEEEIDCLKDLATQLLHSWPTIRSNQKSGKIGEKPATICVISPFKRVASACRAVLETLSLDKRIPCGTVHTFQGKEANIVILVLGSAPGPAGVGSRNWVTARPNILNVAVTRAKNRLYVIGNRNDWKDLNYLRTLAELLPAHSCSELLQSGLVQ